ESLMKTAGEPYEIRLTPDRGTISTGGMDLSFVVIEAYDRNGNLCPLANNRIDLSIKGAGKSAGVGNGDPQSLDPFQADFVRLFYGKALLIVQSGFEKGDLEITASSAGLTAKTAMIRVE
ncbi:MAG: glycoside hydrolase family 2, partial [Bacteroidales bacterium]